MKKLELTFLALTALLLSATFTACSNDSDPEPGTNQGQNQGQDQGQDSETSTDYHFDLWVALDKHGGMGRDVQTLVRSMDNLEAGQAQINFEGTGTEVNSILSMETIVKGEYYYQVPVSADRFSKYTIKDNQINVVKERRFQTNTYACRKYTHAWLNDNTLLIVSAKGGYKSLQWTKLNTDDMSIIGEGDLSIELPTQYDETAGKASYFTTSGILVYRQADNRLFYFYHGKNKVSGTEKTPVTPMHIAVINPSTMAVEKDTPCGIYGMQTVGTAYGELLQKSTFISDNNDLYITCFATEDSGEKSYLMKIPAGATDFDYNYNGFPVGGKLLAVEYLGGNKMVAYARNDAMGTGIDDFSHYYIVIDISTTEYTRLSYNGSALGYSSGRFSSRMAQADGKAFIGIDEENKNPQIYIYDSKTGETVKGAEMATGYYFEQIRVVKNTK